MTSQNCELLLRQVREQLEAALRVRNLNGEACLLQIPFLDQGGDPLRLIVRQEADHFIIDDAGTISGYLFSLGQHTQDTPAFKLLDDLVKAYELEIDRNEGSVKGIAHSYDLVPKVLNLAKVIITVVTATPHMRTRSHRLRRIGPRVAAKIRQDYGQGLLRLVEPNYDLPGTVVKSWPIDFHWQVQKEKATQDVYVLGIDLDVQEPLRKVEYLTTLAVDIKRRLNGSSLRVVADTHGHNSDAGVAMAFLQSHHPMLGYTLVDFGNPGERERFITQSRNEILGEEGRDWRIFWEEHQVSTPRE